MTAPHKQILVFNTTPNWKEKKENLLEKIVGSKAGEKKIFSDLEHLWYQKVRKNSKNDMRREEL